MAQGTWSFSDMGQPEVQVLVYELDWQGLMLDAIVQQNPSGRWYATLMHPWTGEAHVIEEAAGLPEAMAFVHTMLPVKCGRLPIPKDS